MPNEFMSTPHRFIRTTRGHGMCLCGRPEDDKLHTPYPERKDEDYCDHGIPRGEFCGMCE